MNSPTDEQATGAWRDAALAAGLIAVDPFGIGGVSLRAQPGPVRDAWLSLLASLLPGSAALRRVPLNITDGRLLGGLDLAATLRAGRPIGERGVLADADGGLVVLPMAERLTSGTAARLAAVMDSGEVVVERDSVATRTPTRFGVVALDEGIGADEQPPQALRERLGLHLYLDGVRVWDTLEPLIDEEQTASARVRLTSVTIDDEAVAALCAASLLFGVNSARSCLLALRVARAAAALAGRDSVSSEDAQCAARLVLAPRATRVPAGEEQLHEPHPQPPQEGSPSDETDSAELQPSEAQQLEDSVAQAARAAIPAGLLAQIQSGILSKSGAQSAGRGIESGATLRRGRPAGTRRGPLRSGARLNVVETLRAAAPWQQLRHRSTKGDAQHTGTGAVRIEVRPDDFRVSRYKQRVSTTTVFVVDASGSQALNRLAEAKGAVELLLADCYVRRDQVALIAFRGTGAELVLPPTRSLVRAKRSLAGLPGGGGTPLASGLDAALSLADSVRRRGDTPVLVVLTDGRANVTRAGTPGRAQAAEDALASARALRAGCYESMLIDTGPQPQDAARKIAERMGGRYLALPYADASGLARSVSIALGDFNVGSARL